MNKAKADESDKDDEDNPAQQESTFKITFLAIINLKQYVITGGEDGAVVSSDQALRLEG
jgi:hypothetical protein